MVRQANIFKTLMLQMSEAQKLQTAEANSAGLATDRYGIYLESVAAKAAKAQVALESVWQKILDSSTIGGFYDLGTTILKVIDDFGGFVPVIVALSSAMLVYNANTIFAYVSTNILNASLTLTNVLTGGLAIAIGAAVLAIGYFAGATERAAKNAEDLRSQVDQMNSSLRESQEQATQLSDLGKQFDDLKNKTRSTVKEQEDFVDVQNKIKELMPTVNGYYDDQGNFVLNLSTNQKELNKLKQEEIDLEKEQLRLKVNESMKANIAIYEQMIAEMEKLKKQKEDASKIDESTYGVEEKKNLVGDIDAQLKQKSIAMRLFLNQMKSSFTNLTKDERDGWIEYLNTLDTSGKELASKLQGIAAETDRIFQGYNTTPPKVDQFIVLSDALKQINNSVKDTDDLMVKAAEGTLSFADAQELLAKNPDYIDIISIENEKVSINTEKLKENDLALVQRSLDTAMAVLAQDEFTLSQDKTNESLIEAVRRDQETIDILEAYKRSIIDGTAYAETFAAAQKKIADEAKAAQKAAEEAARAQLKLLQEQADAAKKLFDMEIERIKQQKEAEKDHLKEQLQNYKDLIDARIKALDAKKAEEDYTRNLKKDMKGAADIRSQIAILRLDNSPEARAKILELQKQLADQLEKIADEKRDHRYEKDKKALEKEKDDYEKIINEKIKKIDEYLNETGKIAKDAMSNLLNNSEEMYKKLIEWNRLYGTGFDEDVVGMWEKGYDALKNYYDLLEQIKRITEQLNTPPPSPPPPNTPPPSHHAGIESGPVGGIKLKNNEQLAKLLKGELVVNDGQAHNFMNNILPKMAQTTSNVNNMGGSLNIENLITINGNVDKSVLPSIENIANDVLEKINNSTLFRGVKRQANLTSI